MRKIEYYDLCYGPEFNYPESLLFSLRRHNEGASQSNRIG